MTVDLAKLTALAGRARDTVAKHAPPAAARKPWRITNADASDGDTAEVFIYDMIGDWGVTAQDFVNDLAAVTAPNLSVRVNSQGGHVFEGVAIYEAIKRHPAKSTGYVDGLAASAASFIVQGCDVVKMAKTARMMIHDAGVGGLYVEGNAQQIRESVAEILAFAELLDSLSDTIAEIYADKAGGTVAEWRALMSTDKWYTATEAVTAGLADAVVGDEEQDDPGDNVGENAGQETTARWDPRLFAEITKGVLG